jgi:threonine dehydratase
MKEISERSLIWQNKRHYFKIMFAQKAGSLKTFVSDVLGSNDDIFYFGYRQIVGQEIGPAVVGIELKDPFDLEALKKNMDKYGFRYEKIQNYDIF